MKRVWDEQQEARLPPSVELKLRQICESKMQPWPDDDVIRQLAALSEESAKETLEKISTSKSIRTLGGYIKWMIRQQCTAASSPSPSKTVRSGHVQSPDASSIVPQRLQFGTPGESVAHSPVLYHPADHGQAHLEALGELEFRKQFLILSYAGGTKLKDVIDAEDIRNWKNLPMVKFETTVWHVLGEDNVGKADRLLNVDWDSGRTQFYECHVTRDGSYTFKGPYIKYERRTLLQKLSGDDNVLIVKFDGEGTKTRSSNFYDNDYCTYMKLERDGIVVGLRRYRFFGTLSEPSHVEF